jgi:hypothetical protein
LPARTILTVIVASLVAPCCELLGLHDVGSRRADRVKA